MSNTKESKYIISIYSSDNRNWNFEDEGFAYITESAQGNILSVRTQEDQSDQNNKSYLNVLINDKLDITYKESTNQQTPGYTVRFERTDVNKKIGIKFDNNGSASFQNIKTILERIKNSEKKALYHPSGNIWYIGDISDNIVDGDGTEFYDNSFNSIKYVGEFENSKYDGAGIFKSPNGKIEIHSNNLSKGKPIGLCTLIINTLNSPKKKTFKYNDLEIENLNTGDNDFCERIAKHFLPNFDQIMFSVLPTDQKIIELNNKLDRLLKLEEKLDVISKSLEEQRGLLRWIWSLIW